MGRRISTQPRTCSSRPRSASAPYSRKWTSPGWASAKARASIPPCAAEPGSVEFDVQLLLWDLAQSQHLAASQRLATLIQEELNRQLDLPDRGVKQAPFRVLMGAAMPAVLVELGFLSSAAEELRLRDPAYRAELVATLLRALARFKVEYEAQRGAGGAAQ